MSRTSLYVSAYWCVSYLETEDEGSRRLVYDPPHEINFTEIMRKARLDIEVWAGRMGQNVRR